MLSIKAGTFFEGSGRYNGKAHFGLSKEKRSDCPLVTLGLVLDTDGFPKRTEVFEGNVSEPGTLEDMITALSFADMQTKPLIVMDAGIATESNILWLKEKGYGYIVVSRKRKIELSPETAMITVREDARRLIRAALSKGPDDDEITLQCHSTDKEIKEQEIFMGDFPLMTPTVLRKNSTRSVMPFPRSMEPSSTAKSSRRSDGSRNVTNVFPATMKLW